jgi:hypothetical protein
LLLALLLGLAALQTVLAFLLTRVLFFSVPFLLLAALAFHSLTIEITDWELRWHFGIGIIHKRVALADLASAKVVRTNFLEGWGIHWSRFGWLYNVSGYDAVAVTLRSGKRFALGTDEPQVLAAQLNQAMQKSGGGSP